MINTIIHMARSLVCLLPFIIFALLNTKANLKREVRSSQFLMPILTLLYTLVLMVFLSKINSLFAQLIALIPNALASLAQTVAGWAGGALEFLAKLIEKLGSLLETVLNKVNPIFLLLFVSNAVFMLAHIIVKRILITFFKAIFKRGGRIHDYVVGPFYEKDEDIGMWHVRSHFSQARTFLKSLYYASLILSAVAVLVTCELYRSGYLGVPFYPVFGVMIIGELFFFLDGLNKEEMQGSLSHEEQKTVGVANYTLLRKVLSKLFGDKLSAENTTINLGDAQVTTSDEVLNALEQSDDAKFEAYGRFMRKKLSQGFVLDHNYLVAGSSLLEGKSILFNTPFYYDLIPYVSYPMNRVLLRRKRVLIILGRHDIENDVEEWCRTGLTSVTGIPSMWRIGVLDNTSKELDVGILTRSSVHDLELHNANQEFLKNVEFVFIIEPSKLVTTAQIGLNSLVRRCNSYGNNISYCSTDKNCDGLVDSLSHILLKSLTEVSATNHHEGTSSYMCWDTDEELLQHRLLPNLSRYLGMGTELSFAALKNQVSETSWYGGEVFPVVDIHWIAKQYYYDLLRYANLPASQESMDKHFKVSPNLWNAEAGENRYLTVEDEAYNMFEVKRVFSTRAKNQGFVNIISSEYLLKDYMTANNELFNADPKAIPYIVADYAPSVRNVIMRLCLRMSSEMLREEDIRHELELIDISVEDFRKDLWHEICKCCSSFGQIGTDREGREILTVRHKGKEYIFSPDTLELKRKFSLESGKMENMYCISDSHFTDMMFNDLRNAGYIAEDEKGERQYLGTELRGHIFQKYLPGQFFTFGGKYYEMLRVSESGQVLVRRAADHITGRPTYRQVRNYHLSNIKDSTLMGDKTDVAGLTVTKQIADIRVETPAYWQMSKHNDFAKGRKVSINGVPERTYCGKNVLRIDLPAENLNPKIISTITLLFNEVFRTLFADNHAFIAAVAPGEIDIPTTYSLSGVEGENCIYIIEDSQLDLGLLVSVQRNLNRIFSIICDYLDWHMGAMEASLNPPPPPEVPDYTVKPEDAEEEAPKGIRKVFFGIKKFFKKIGGFFKKIWSKIAEFFKKLFKRKPKEEPEAEDDKQADTSENDQLSPDAENADAIEGEEISGTEDAETSEEEAEAAQDAADTETAAGEEAAPAEDNEEQETEAEEAETAEVEEEEETEGEKADDSEEEEVFALMSCNASSEPAPETEPETEDEAEDEDEAGSGEAAPEHDVEQDDLSFEPSETAVVSETGLPGRKPYHQRHYLLYGGTEVPAQVDIAGTHEYLDSLGFGNSELKQARDGVTVAEMIEKGYDPNRPGSKICDFCGVELTGTEYEILSDGRDRCMMCGRSAIKTEEEFVELYKTVIHNLETFFGARITAPIKVEMVNSKKLHKRLKRTFVPTDSFDGRTLGVAIKSKNGYSILLENGAPRIQSIMTIAHELIHIWQYLNWDQKKILSKYGKAQELEVYEGMAKWGEIQYAYFIGETATAKREEICTCLRQDEYGRGFVKYLSKYPLSTEIRIEDNTPFADKESPL